MTKLVRTENIEAVAVVTLDRPDAMNALSRALRVELSAALRAADSDPGVRVIILTGAGERAFTAGLDLKELGSDPRALSAANATDPEDNPVAAVKACKKPVIGAVNGVAITGGFELALACDILIASQNARFADTHVRVGVMPGWGLTQQLSRVIGPYRARELSLSGNFLDADSAYTWGLVNRVVAADALMEASLRLANDIASADPSMVAAVKSLINEGYCLSLQDGLALEHQSSSQVNSTLSPAVLEQNRKDVQIRGRAQK